MARNYKTFEGAYRHCHPGEAIRRKPDGSFQVYALRGSLGKAAKARQAQRIIESAKEEIKTCRDSRRYGDLLKIIEGK